MPRECPDCQGAGEVNANQTSDPQRDDPQRCGACSGQGVLLSERSRSVHGLIQWARGMCTDELPHVEIDAVLSRAVDAAKDLEEQRGFYARANEILRRQVDDCLVRARDAERAHLQMVRKAGELRDLLDADRIADAAYKRTGRSLDRPTLRAAIAALTDQGADHA